MIVSPAGRGTAGRRAPVPSGPGWTVEIASDDGALGRLAGELRGLYDRGPAATPFQAPAWQAAWWAAYGTPGGLRVVLVRRRGRLVAAAPLTLARRWGLPVLRPVAAGQSDFTDVLLDPAHLDDAASRLARALLGMPGWCALDLPEVRPGAMVHLVAAHWPRRTWRTPASVCLELPATGVGGLLARLPGRAAGRTRARLRRIDRRGITAERVPAHRAADAVHALLDLHALQWRGRPMNPEHGRDRFRRHLAGAAAAMVRDGQAAVIRYHDGGRLVAADLALVGHRFVGAYLYGAAPGLRDGVDVALMLLREDLALARDLGRPALSLLRGDEPYKRKWRPDAVRNQRIVLGRTPPAAAFAALARARAHLAAHHPATASPHPPLPPVMTAPGELPPETSPDALPVWTSEASTCGAGTGGGAGFGAGGGRGGG